MAKTISPLTQIPEYPARKDPQERFDTKIKEAVDGGAIMVREINEGFIPQIDALAADVESAKDIAQESGASALASKDAAAQSAAAAETSRQKAETARAGAEAAKDVAEEASILSAQVLANQSVYQEISSQIPMLTRVDAIRSDVTTVAGIEASVASVATRLRELSAVYSALPTIESVEDNLSRIAAVHTAEESIKQLALHRNSIAAVGAGMDAVSAVADAMPSLEAVKDDLPHVRTVSGHMANVDAVGRNIASVREVDHRMQLIIDAPGNAATASAAATESTRQAELARQHAESAAAVAGLPAATEQNDQQVVIWSKADEKFVFGAPVGVNIVPAPPITVASQVPVGFDSPILLTGLIGLVGTTIDSFQLQINDSAIQDLPATNNVYSGVIKAQGADGDIWTIKARAVDSRGNISAWNQATTVLVVPFANKPTVTLPISSTAVSNRTVLMECAPFGTTHHVDTHKASRWTVSSDAEGNSVLHDSGWRQDALMSYTAVIDPAAQASSALFVRVQHEGLLLGQSEKSSAIPVTTSCVLIPSVTVPRAGSMVGTVNIEMASSDFATYGGNFDTHDASRWRVTTDSEGNNALCDSGWVSSHLTSYTATLSPVSDPATELYLWAEHRGELLGAAPRSEAVKVSTAFVQPPVMTARGDFTTPRRFACESSRFSSAGGVTDKMIKEHIQIATDVHFTTKVLDAEFLMESIGGLTTYTIPAQPQGTMLYARTRYEGETLGWSDWSVPAVQTVATAGSVTVTSPANGSTGVNVKPQIAISIFTDNGGVDRGSSTQVQISTDVEFSELTYDSGEIAYSTSHTVATALAPSVRYYIRARHKGAELGWTDWSDIAGITTGKIEAPTIASPPDRANLQTSFVVSGTVFTAAGVDTLKAVTIQVAKDTRFADKIYDQRNLTTSTTCPVSIPPQAGSPALYVRMMYEGHAFGESDWSNVVQIAVSPVLAPSITSPAAGTTVFNSVTIVASAFTLTSGVADSHASTDWKITADAAGNEVIAQTDASSDKARHTFAGFDFAGGNNYYLWARHNGATFGAGPWSVPRMVTIEVGNTPGGRYIYRHSSNKGTVMEFYDGKLRKVLILDALYRAKFNWGTYGYDMPNLKNYTRKNSRGDWFLNTRNAQNIEAETKMTDAQINALWINSTDEKMARENCDEWMTRNDSSDSKGIAGVPAVAHARSLSVDGECCDIPNVQTLMRIFLDADELDALDPTVAANRTKALGSQNSDGFWNCMGTSHAWSSTEFDGIYMLRVGNTGYSNSVGKNGSCFAIPILEL